MRILPARRSWRRSPPIATRSAAQCPSGGNRFARALRSRAGQSAHYACPRGGARVRTEEMLKVRARQRALEFPRLSSGSTRQAIREDAAAEAGLRVRQPPADGAWMRGLPRRHRPTAGIEIRLATAEDDIATSAPSPRWPSHTPGRRPRQPDSRRRRQQALARPAESVGFERDRRRAGTTALAFPWRRSSAGDRAHQPLGDVTEVVGVATLPSFRRRLPRAAATVYLVADAQARGTPTIFLSAGSDRSKPLPLARIQADRDGLCRRADVTSKPRTADSRESLRLRCRPNRRFTRPGRKSGDLWRAGALDCLRAGFVVDATH